MSLFQLGLALGLYFVLLWGGPFSDAFDFAPYLRGTYTLALHGGFVLVFTVLFLRKGLRLHSGSVFVALCGITGLLGFALPALTAGYHQWQGLAIALSALLSACSTAMLLYAGVWAMAGLPADRRFKRFLESAALGLTIFLIVFWVLPADYRALVICIALVPLALLTTFSTVAKLEVPAIQSDALRPARMLQLCLSVFLLGLISTLLIQAGDVVQVLQIPLALLSGAVFALLWRFRKSTLGVTEIYLVLFPVVATLLLILPFGNALFRNTAIFVSNAAVQILLLTVFVQPQSFGKAYVPRLVVALLAVFHLSAMVGVGGGTVFRFLFEGDNTLMVGAVYFCLYALSAFAFALLTLRGRKAAGEQGGDGTASSAVPMGAVNDTSAKGLVAKSAPVTDDAGAPQANAQSEHTATDDSDAGSADTADVLSARAAEAYGLSPREAEVLDLLLRGRDVRAIADMLVISQNTVRFHVKNLYKAAGVHSKQELIDAVEQLR